MKILKQIDDNIYKSIIHPVVVLSGCETWTMTKFNESLKRFEREIIRKIFGPILDQSYRPVRNSVKLTPRFISRPRNCSRNQGRTGIVSSEHRQGKPPSRKKAFGENDEEPANARRDSERERSTNQNGEKVGEVKTHTWDCNARSQLVSKQIDDQILFQKKVEK